MAGRITKVLSVVLACALLWSQAVVGQGGDGLTPPGTAISVRAEATYVNEAGDRITTVSETATVTVGDVSGIAVTPDESAPSSASPPHARATKIFRACNTGNVPDTFTLTRAEVSAPAALAALHFDLDGSGTLTQGDTPITVGQTSSPPVPPGACVGVLAEVDTNDAPVNSWVTVRLAAQGNAGGSGNHQAQDQGTIIYGVGTGPAFSAPDNPQQPPVKLVEGQSRVTATPGQTLTYTITFVNSGDAPALDVVVTDELPSHLEYVPGSLLLGARRLTDADDGDEGRAGARRLEVRLQRVAPGEVVVITFRARLAGQTLPGAGVLNHAVISAANVPVARETSDAAVVSNPSGVVYAGDSGGAVKVGGATVVVSTDRAGEHPLALTAETGTVPNGSNANPFTTGAQGEFNFVPSPSQVGTEAQPATYFVSVIAPGFHRRLLEATLRPRGRGLFALTARALDNQPLARGGSFSLTDEAIQLDDLAVVALNIPLFETSTFEITKTADRQRVEIGETVTYRVEARNPMSSPISAVILRDRLPASFHYVPGTARLTVRAGIPRAVEPEMAGGEMVFRLERLAPGESFAVAYRARVGVNAVEGEQFNSAAAEGALPSNKKISTARARAGVVVGRGIFGSQQAIIGRVFEDADGDGQFDAGERPVRDARLYLSNGDLVITDSEGMYNFPLVSGGALVISLDPVSIPSGYKLLDDNQRAGRSWARLLRTPLGGGSLLRQNFALLPPTGVRGAGATLKAATGDEKGAQPSPATPPQSTQKLPLAAGTYELEAAGDVIPVAPGAIRIDSPALNHVVMSPALNLEATVAEGWGVALEVGGVKVSDLRIGERRVDHKNKVSTYAFVGINLRPGPNRIKATAVSPEGKMGGTAESVVYGRGPARRLEIVPEKKELAAGGRESTLIHVRAFDQWNHPAAEDMALVEASSGTLRPEACAPADASGPSCPPPAAVPEGPASARTSTLTLLPDPRADAGAGPAVAPADAAARQQKLSLNGGEARLVLIAGNAPGGVELRASLGAIEARASLRFLPEMRPTILVGLAEVSIGRAAPDREWQNVHGSTSSRLSFFYRGRLFGKNLLTVAYDSHRRLHRVAGRDRLFQPDPRERVYPIFGDSSARFEEAQSNSRLYARLDRGPSFLLFGDFNPDQDGAGAAGRPTAAAGGPGAPSNSERMLTGYSRNLTGLKLHLENGRGDFVTLTGARPETAFARDVFPGGSFGLLQLSRPGILPGSETVVLEVRDRRNPEIIISREPLSRSADYDLDPNAGTVFLLRPILSFDYALNLLQIVVTYEYLARDLSSAVYTARARKYFAGLGLRAGVSMVHQRQSEFGAFNLAGADFEKSLPRGGLLQLEWGMSRGRVAAGGNLFDLGPEDGEHNGHAYRADLYQPLPFYEGVLRASLTRADAGFFNPFGATVSPGSQRATATVEFKPRPSSVMRLGLTHERNKTDNFDNRRLTASVGWSERISDRLQFSLAYDFRAFDGGADGESVSSHLLTFGAEWRPTDKLTLAFKREQNLAGADPTYPSQTTLSANYRVNPLTRLFFTQRLASAPIVPISDVSRTGFASTGARSETAFGVETRLGRNTSLSGRYQIENGVGGRDSFAVIGLQNRLPLSKTLSVEFGYERGQHLSGEGTSFNGASVGFSWLPTENFRSSARYELRDRNGFGQMLTLGAAGKAGDDVTMLASFQSSRTMLAGRASSATSATAALALRPLKSDRAALLFSYSRRSLFQEGETHSEATRQRSDTLATDGLLSLKKELELYGRFAFRLSEDGRPDLPRASTLTYLAQGRLQHRFGDRYDAAAEGRWLAQPATGTRQTSMGLELGYWVLPDLRVGAGYNLVGVREPRGNLAAAPGRSGFYFTISSKLSNLFNLFGTSKKGLAGQQEEPQIKAGGQRP